MYLKYSYQDLLECADELKQINKIISRIENDLEQVKFDLRRNSLDACAEDVHFSQNSIKESVLTFNEYSEILYQIAELFSCTDKKVRENNLKLIKPEAYGSLLTSSYNYNQSANSLIVEPWLRKLMEEEEDEQT